MTSIHVLNLNVLNMYLQIKREVSTSRLSEVRAQTGETDKYTQTDMTQRIITPHSREVK